MQGSGPDANLSRFQGSASISSAEYFGRTEVPAGGRASGLSAPDMDDVKESGKQGVTKVAGRLSNMASGMMTQIQASRSVRLFAIASLFTPPLAPQSRMGSKESH